MSPTSDGIDPIVVTANKLSFDPGYGIVTPGFPSFLGSPSAGQWNPVGFSALAAEHGLGVSVNHLKITPQAGVQDNSDYQTIMIAVDGNNVVQGVSLFTGSTGEDVGSDEAAIGMDFSDYLVSKGLAPPGGPTSIH